MKKQHTGFSFLIISVCLLGLCAGAGDRSYAQQPNNQAGDVWIVFFSSSGCPRCTGIMKLIAALGDKFPIRLKTFDIDVPEDYELFSALESIHSDRRFAVPLVIVGNKILIGATEIKNKLERVVAGLAKRGGAPLPYLGTYSDARSDQNSEQSDCDCDDRRPPTLEEEWTKVRGFIDKLIKK